MRRYLARRLALLLPTLLGISFAAFAIMRLIPGDPAQVMLGEHATAEQVALFRERRGLDDSLPVQYAHYLGRLLRGDWGRSIKTNISVTEELVQRLPATMELGVMALAIACALGLPLGVLAAVRSHALLDWLASGSAVLGVSLPIFWLGLLAAYVFGYRLGWLPPSGRLTIGVQLVPVTRFYLLDSLIAADVVALADVLRHLALPALVLSTVPLATVVRMTRACLLETLTRDYVRTARAKGLAERTVILVHTLRNALPSVVTVVGIQFATLLSGAMLTETVFSWPGVGQYVIDRVLSRDYPAVQGVVLVTALLVVSVNLVVDVICALLDPRIRYE
jgi:peptide/nickel transport system permease protein